jgi:hypothetical protein
MKSVAILRSRTVVGNGFERESTAPRERGSYTCSGGRRGSEVGLIDGVDGREEVHGRDEERDEGDFRKIGVVLGERS